MAYKQNGQYDYDKIYYYSDTQNYELYYNERPTINFNSVEITGTYTGQEINGKIYDYVTHFRFNYSIKGCFWMNSLQYTIQQQIGIIIDAQTMNSLMEHSMLQEYLTIQF